MRLQSLSRLLLVFVLAAAIPSVSQNPPLRLPDAPRHSPTDEPRLRMEREMAKKANLERQADLKRDTDKLLKLANELKEYVDKTNESYVVRGCGQEGGGD